MEVGPGSDWLIIPNPYPPGFKRLNGYEGVLVERWIPFGPVIRQKDPTVAPGKISFSFRTSEPTVGAGEPTVGEELVCMHACHRPLLAE